MRLFRKIKTFAGLPPAVKLLFAEALFTSALVKLTLKFFPFKKVLNWLGNVQQQSGYEANSETLLIRNQVKRALVLCDRYALWPTECYTLSLTGKLLLKKRNISSTLYIGFCKENDSKIKGHAWLRANDTFISGYREARGYTVHSTFS